MPNDPVLLHQVVRDLACVLERQTAELAETKARLADRDTEIEKLQLFLSALKRRRFGRSSEKCHPDQLTLSLEAIEGADRRTAGEERPRTLGGDDRYREEAGPPAVARPSAAGGAPA